MSREQHISDLLDTMKADGYAARAIRRRRYAVADWDVALGLMERLGRERTPKFRIDGHNRWAYTQLLKWLYGDPGMQALDPVSGKPLPGRLEAGIYLAGSTGTGKSWALELLADFTRLDGIQVDIEGEPVRLWWEPFRAEDIWEDCCTRDGALCDYKSRRILCIQDLGAEPEGDAVRMGSRREPLRQILESRGDRTDRITLISSNFGICDKEVEQRYTERTVSRLREMCNFLVMPGPDRRTL